MSAAIARLNTAGRSVKLTWPRAIRDMHSTYVVEARAPRKSYIWETHAHGLLATSAVIKGLELDGYDYEFRVRTSNCSGLGEPTQPTSTRSLREKGDAATATSVVAQSSRVSPSISPSDWHTSNVTNPSYATNSTSWHPSLYGSYHKLSHLVATTTSPRARCSSLPRNASFPAPKYLSPTYCYALSKRQRYIRSSLNSSSHHAGN